MTLERRADGVAGPFSNGSVKIMASDRLNAPPGPMTLRMVLCLGLILVHPIIAEWFSMGLYFWYIAFLRFRPLSVIPLRIMLGGWASLACLLLIMAPWWLIWRRFVHWTTIKRVVTIGVMMISFLPLFCSLNSPSWYLWCKLESVAMGLFFLSTVWLWWGRKGSEAGGTTLGGRYIMSENGKCVLASMGVLLLIKGVHQIVSYSILPLFFAGIFEYEKICLASLISGCLMVALWIWIWFKRITWDRSTIRKTRFYIGLFMLLPIALVYILGFLFTVAIETQHGWWYLGATLPSLGWGLWVIVTPRGWTYRSADAATDGPEAPRCPRCGYSLQGLTHTRCPECGHEPTLDQLWSRAREQWLQAREL